MRKSFLYTFFFGINLLLFLGASYPFIDSLVSAWSQDEYSHGYLIPFIAFFIGWHRLVEYKPVLKPCSEGLFFICIGWLFILIAQFSAFQSPAHYGVIISLAGILYTYTGREVMKALWPAFIYLFFCVPLPRLIYVALSQDLQLLSSTLGVLPLQFLGIPVFQDGNVIDLGTIQLQVVEACNGLRYLFPLMSFGFLMAFLYEASFWKRALIFISTIPITIFMNAFRIALIGITVSYWGQEAAEGLIHDMEGFVVFSLCVLFLMLEVWILLKIGRAGRFRYDYFDLPKGSLFSTVIYGKTPILALIISICFAFWLSLEEGHKRPDPVPVHKAVSSFPLFIGPWKGHAESLPSTILSELKLTDYWIANYSEDLTKDPINLYMAYYENQGVGSSVHSPANCLPGSGWVVEDSRVIPIVIRNMTLPIKRVLIRKGENAMLVYYWFEQRGRQLTSQYQVKWYLFMDALLTGRRDGALVRLFLPLNKQSAQEGDQRLRAFLNYIVPLLYNYIPSYK